MNHVGQGAEDLCLKDARGGLQGEVQVSWFDNCAEFLRRRIEIVRPRVVVGLGQRAYQGIMGAFGVQVGPFRAEVEEREGRVLPNGTRVFAVCNCGARIRNTHRPMDKQQSAREKAYVRAARGQPYRAPPL